MGRSIKLRGYSVGQDITITAPDTDAPTESTEGSHLGPIDYIRSTGVPGQFATCTCDNTDDVRVWDCQGGNAKLQEVHKIGQLGNHGLCTAKASQLIAVPGKSPELRVYNAKAQPSKKGEYLDKVWVLKASANETRFAGMSECGQILMAADSRTIFIWRLNATEQKSELVATLSVPKDIYAADVLRPVNEDNYHDSFVVLAYATGMDLHLVAFKEGKVLEEIGRDCVRNAHINKIKIVRLAVIGEKVVVLTVANDKCIKLWEVPNEWLPRCSLMWIK